MFVVLVYTKWSFEILVVQTSQTLCQKWKFIEKSPRNMALLAVPRAVGKKMKKHSAINHKCFFMILTTLAQNQRFF